MHPSVWRDTWSIFKFNIQGLGNSALWNGLATSPASPPYNTWSVSLLCSWSLLRRHLVQNYLLELNNLYHLSYKWCCLFHDLPLLTRPHMNLFGPWTGLFFKFIFLSSWTFLILGTCLFISWIVRCLKSEFGIHIQRSFKNSLTDFLLVQVNSTLRCNSWDLCYLAVCCD
jgi:hypothetical protein